jgi:protein-L-isoaspartate O-methyltransferase
MGIRMFIPVEDSRGQQWIWVVEKDRDGQVKKEKTMGVRYVPLTVMNALENCGSVIRYG